MQISKNHILRVTNFIYFYRKKFLPLASFEMFYGKKNKVKVKKPQKLISQSFLPFTLSQKKLN